MLSSSPESLYVCLYTVLIPYLLYCTIFTLYSSVQTVCTVVIEGGGTTVQKLPLCLNSMCYQTICTVASEGGGTAAQKLSISLNSMCYHTIYRTIYVQLLVKEAGLQYQSVHPPPEKTRQVKSAPIITLLVSKSNFGTLSLCFDIFL